MKKLSLGCDPEVFLSTITGDLKSSVGLLGGSKSHPLELPIGKGYAVQEDNVALEFNVPPASGAEEFVVHIQNAIQFLEQHVQGQYGLRFDRRSAALFPMEELQTREAQEFGCDPDFNAYTGRANPRPAAEDKTLRSCGGHVHVGLDPDTDRRMVVRQMDKFLGVPSVLMDEGDMRKQLYGKPGAYRMAPWGVEYRVLSNFWIFDPATIRWVWNNTERAVTAAESRLAISKEDEAAIVTAINDNNKGLARELVQQFNLETVGV